VLRGLAGLAVLVSAGGALSACGSDEPDPLRVLADRALTDAAVIDRVRADPTLKPDVGTRLGELADARRAHAKALIVALGDDPADTPAPSSTPAPSGGDSGLAQVRGRLNSAQRQAAKLVPGLAREHAGLVGEIAACCAAYRAVLS
jgi:hypothetical protein